MAPTKTANVADFLLLELFAQIMMQFLLRSRAQAGGAIANKHFFVRIFLLQEIVSRNCSQRHGVSEQGFRAQRANRLCGFRRAFAIGGIDHAFEKVFFDTLTEGKRAEVFGHGKEGSIRGLMG
jgi:hypothetical protein